MSSFVVGETVEGSSQCLGTVGRVGLLSVLRIVGL